jgi:hypothetical protein
MRSRDDFRSSTRSKGLGVWLDADEMHMLAHVAPRDMMKVIREIDTAAS